MLRERCKARDSFFINPKRQCLFIVSGLQRNRYRKLTTNPSWQNGNDATPDMKNKTKETRGARSARRLIAPRV